MLQFDHLRFGFGERVPDFLERAASESDAVHAAQPIRKLLQLVAPSHGGLPAVEEFAKFVVGHRRRACDREHISTPRGGEMLRQSCAGTALNEPSG